jgi:biotin synthase
MQFVADLETVTAWLQETEPSRLDDLRGRADRVRRERVGDAVQLRGLIEVSNHCVRHCTYCGLRATHTDLPRFRMEPSEVLSAARAARELGCGVVVLKAGEDPGLTRDGVADLVRAVKAETGLVVTLSLGERPVDDLAAWREAGADRYLLRFETSNAVLYRVFHPRGAGRVDLRLQRLRQARELGFGIGTGVMVGLPGQTWHDLARDLLLFKLLDPDLVVLGPWIPHPATPAVAFDDRGTGPERLATNDAASTLKAFALARLLCPDANLPATAALATVSPDTWREDGLAWGANVVTANLTPARYRQHYLAYPGKAGHDATPPTDLTAVREHLASLGRSLAVA